MYKAQLVKLLLEHIRECTVKHDVDLHDGIYAQLACEFDDIPEASNGHVVVVNKQQMIDTLVGKIRNCLQLHCLGYAHEVIYKEINVAFDGVITELTKKTLPKEKAKSMPAKEKKEVDLSEQQINKFLEALFVNKNFKKAVSESLKQIKW